MSTWASKVAGALVFADHGGCRGNQRLVVAGIISYPGPYSIEAQRAF